MIVASGQGHSREASGDGAVNDVCEAARGGGTYTLEQLTDKLLGGKYKGTI